MNTIDFSNEKTILATTDNIFVPSVNEDDSPEIVAIKQIIATKKIDLNAYKHKFGTDYSQNKRVLKTDINTMKELAANFDIKVTLVIHDSPILGEV